MKKTFLMMAAVLTASVMSVNAQDLTQATATCGQTVTITATPDAGYKFLYWDDDHSNTTATRTVTIDENTTIYDYVAVFGVAKCNVIANVNETTMGSVTGGGEYDFGDKVTLTATPASKCYRFVKWSDDVEDATREITVAAADADNTYTAIFEEVEFTVKASVQGAGSVVVARQ